MLNIAAMPRSELSGAAKRTAAVIRAAGEPGALVPGLEWTVAETAAHVVNEFGDYAAYAQGRKKADLAGSSPARRNAAANAVQLREDPDRDLGSLADRLGVVVDEFLAARDESARDESARDESARDEPMPARDEAVLVSNGVRMTWPTMMSALLGELLVHGWDIARASGQPWRIERAEALHVIARVMTMIPDYLDRERAAGVTASFELRLRGGPRYLISVADQEAVVTPGGGKADCWISADPVAFLLVGFGRVGQWGQILRGGMLAGGRKPWLATRFGSLITGP
jgi:uncharacterized protein (TIGR03083 family)